VRSASPQRAKGVRSKSRAHTRSSEQLRRQEVFDQSQWFVQLSRQDKEIERERISTARRAIPSYFRQWRKLEVGTLCLPSSFLLGLTLPRQADLIRRRRQPQCANRGVRRNPDISDAYRHVGESEKGGKIWETFPPQLSSGLKKKKTWHDDADDLFFLRVKISRSLNPPHDIFRLFFINFANCSKTSRLLYIYIFMINILIYKHLDILFWTVWGPRLNFCFRLVMLRYVTSSLPSKRVQKKEKFFGYFFELLYS